MASHRVKFQSVSLEVMPWKHPSGRGYWRFIWHNPEGQRIAVTRATLKDAKDAALRKAMEIAKGTLDLDNLTPAQIRGIRRMLDADPSMSHVDEFLLWHGRKAPKKNLGEAIDEFLAAKEDNRGRSHQNVRTLRSHLKTLAPLRDRIVAEISVNELPVLTGAPRTRKNIRSAWVTFFRWCIDREFIPPGKTAPERLEKPIAVRKVPETYSKAQLDVLFRNVRPEHLPWLACAAFAGIRTDETCPAVGGEKSPLDWSDFHWDREIIIIRPETDKNGQRRVVPILPALRHWLFPIRQSAGRISPPRPPSNSPRVGTESETTRLGHFIGGWQRNALRHSFISYRAAQVGLARAAAEAGNSESEARKSYNDAKSEAEAEAWFKVPECSQNP